MVNVRAEMHEDAKMQDTETQSQTHRGGVSVVWGRGCSKTCRCTKRHNLYTDRMAWMHICTRMHPHKTCGCATWSFVCPEAFSFTSPSDTGGLTGYLGEAA